VRDQLLRRGLVDHYGLHQRETAGATTPAEPAEIPDDVALDELPPWEAHLWRTPQLSAHQRRILIEITRELDRRLG
jgi:hypothetical protein